MKVGGALVPPGTKRIWPYVCKEPQPYNFHFVMVWSGRINLDFSCFLLEML